MSKIYRVKPSTGAGCTVRRACYEASVTAKKEKATKVVIAMQLGNGDVRVHSGGMEWLDRVGLLEIAKQC